MNKYAQATNTLLMVEPVAFGFNPETAVNNFFQKETQNAQQYAVVEFWAFVNKLRQHGVNVITITDDINAPNTDSIFPNNAVSFHEDGTVFLYPMFAINRRCEIADTTLETIKQRGFSIQKVNDYRHFAEQELFLEGTGSMVIDHVNRIAYACRAERTNEQLFVDFCQERGLEPMLFTANQSVGEKRLPIYHTNVMMAVADTFVVICLASLDIPSEKAKILAAFEQTGKEVIDISESQMNQFAGNMLQVLTNPTTHDSALVMSGAAYRALHKEQIQRIEAHCPIIYADIPTIETNGGGSVRCMMAEIFLPHNT